jgi:hypothetical protein
MGFPVSSERPAGLSGFLSRVQQRNGGKPAKPHLAQLAGARSARLTPAEDEGPALRAASLDNEVGVSVERLP